MRRLYAVIALLALGGATAGVTGCRKEPVDARVRWDADVDSAIARAMREHRLVLVYFGAEWDTAAKMLEHETFTDPEVYLLLHRRFVAVRVDATDDENPETRRLAERYRVVGDPTVIILAADGTTEIARFNEFVPPAVLLRMLKIATGPNAVFEAWIESEARQRAAATARWEEQMRLHPPPPPPEPGVPIALTPLP